MENNQMNEDIIVTLEMEDGETVDCIVVTLFEAAGKEYAALMPQDEENEEDPEIVFYRYIEEGEDGILESIDDDEEYEIVEDAFDQVLDNIEFESLGEEK